MRVVKAATGETVAAEVERADTFFARLLGLIPRSGLKAGEGLLLDPCDAVHTCFMRFTMDAVFLSPGLKVLKVERGMRPWRFSSRAPGARYTLELPEGGAAGVSEGDTLAFL